MRLLLAEDERALSKALATILERSNYSVDTVYDGEAALEYLAADNYDGVILDIMMPKKDGITVLKELRSQGSKIPVLILTAKSEVDDKVLGLDSGADDYVAKPFGMMELLARVKALLRRTEQAESEEVYRLGALSVNKTRHEVYAAGQEVTLTLKEFDLLCLLLENKGRVLTRDQLLNRIWGYGFDGENRTVDVHIRTLRQKLGECGEYIETVRGVGYKVGGNI